MGISLFKRSKINEEDAHYHEDNIIKMKESDGIKSKGINIKTGMRIVNLFGAILTLIIIAAILIGIYWFFTNFLDLAPFINENPETTQVVSSEKDLIAKESRPVWG